MARQNFAFAGQKKRSKFQLENKLNLEKINSRNNQNLRLQELTIFIIEEYICGLPVHSSFQKNKIGMPLVGSSRREIEIFLILLLVMSLNKKKIVGFFLISKNNLTYIIEIRSLK